MISNKWKNAIIPAILIHISIGIVYCWSYLYKYISPSLDHSGNLGWSFSISIFLLGLSAAILGPLLKRRIKLSGILGSLLFGSGFLLSALGVYLNQLWIFFLGFGIFVGLSMGISYISPIKVVMSWWNSSNQRGLAIGLVLSGFGFGKVIYIPLIALGFGSIGIPWTLAALGILGMLVISVSTFFLEPVSKNNLPGRKYDSFKAWIGEMRNTLLLPGFMTLWTIFLLNIAVGLAIISYEIYFLIPSGISIILGCILAGVFNSGSRAFTGWLADRYGIRERWLGILLSISCVTCFLSFLFQGLILLAVIVCNFTFGSMFSIIPNILADRYGMNRIVETHSLILSSWAIAGLIGNKVADLVTDINPEAHHTLLLICSILYLIALSMSTKFWGDEKTEENTIIDIQENEK